MDRDVFVLKNLRLKAHNVGKDPGPHQVGHLGHQVNIHRALSLQLLEQGVEGTECPGCHTTITTRTAQCTSFYLCGLVWYINYTALKNTEYGML